MPVLVNNETGFAENVPQEQVPTSLETHGIPLVDPDGQHVIAPFESVQSLVQAGFRQPTTDELKELLKISKFSTKTEQLKTAAEGAASALSLGTSTLAEKVLGTNPEDIIARREINPGSHMLGQLGGLGVGTALGFGAPTAMGRIGLAARAGAEALLPLTTAGRIGSVAAQLAAENAIFQAGDEASKLFANDPHASMETAAANIGMAGLLGMGMGTAGKGATELWSMGPGKKLTSIMETMANKSQGLPSELKAAAGIELSPEIEAALSGNPTAQAAFQTLQESVNTKAGAKLQESITTFKKQMQDATLEALGKTPEQLSLTKDLSKAETGRELQANVGKAIEAKAKPITEAYEKFESEFANTALTSEAKINLQNEIANYITTSGIAKGANEEGLQLAQKTLKNIGKQETVEDLRKYVSSLREVAPYGNPAYNTGKELRSILNNSMEQAMDARASSTTPELYTMFKSTQEEYAKFKDVLSDLNDRLHLGKESQYGPASFVKALKEADPETIANRLQLKDDTNLQMTLQQHFPEASQAIRQYEVDRLVKASLDSSGELNTQKLFRNIDKLEPELKSYLFSPRAAEQLSALNEVATKMPSRLNPSGTARTIDALWNKMPESAAAIIATLIGQNPVAGYLMGKVSKYIGKELPDASRLALLKFLGGKGEISAAGLKATATMADAVIKGEKALTEAADSVFNISSKVIPFPEAKVLDKLQNTLDKVAAAPEELSGTDTHVQIYNPDHAVAIGTISGRAIAYLSALKPENIPAAPLDKVPTANPVQEARYKRALVVAQSPLTVFDSIKKGTLTPEQMQDLYGIYPSLYMRMQEKLYASMTDAVDKKEEIPYSTKITASMFLAQPLESSLQPQNIIASWPMPQMVSMPKSTNRVSKVPNLSATPGQATEMRKTARRH